jgi:hypothetical protein
VLGGWGGLWEGGVEGIIKGAKSQVKSCRAVRVGRFKDRKKSEACSPRRRTVELNRSVNSGSWACLLSSSSVFGPPQLRANHFKKNNYFFLFFLSFFCAFSQFNTMPMHIKF